MSVLKRLASLESKVANLMSTESDLEAKLAQIETDFAKHVADDAASRKVAADALAALQAKLAAMPAGAPVTQDQLDALLTHASAIDAAITAAPTS